MVDGNACITMPHGIKPSIRGTQEEGNSRCAGSPFYSMPNCHLTHERADLSVDTVGRGYPCADQRQKAAEAVWFMVRSICYDSYVGSMAMIKIAPDSCSCVFWRQPFPACLSPLFWLISLLVTLQRYDGGHLCSMLYLTRKRHLKVNTKTAIAAHVF